MSANELLSVHIECVNVGEGIYTFTIEVWKCPNGSIKTSIKKDFELVCSPSSGSSGIIPPVTTASSASMPQSNEQTTSSLSSIFLPPAPNANVDINNISIQPQQPRRQVTRDGRIIPQSSTGSLPQRLPSSSVIHEEIFGMICPTAPLPIHKRQYDQNNGASSSTKFSRQQESSDF